MMNKKLTALLLATATVSTTMFGDGFFGGLGRATESVVSAPADVVSGGRTWEKRHDRWAEEDMNRKEEQRKRMKQRNNERHERDTREDERGYSSNYYSGATR